MRCARVFTSHHDLRLFGCFSFGLLLLPFLILSNDYEEGDTCKGTQRGVRTPDHTQTPTPLRVGTVALTAE